MSNRLKVVLALSVVPFVAMAQAVVSPDPVTDLGGFLVALVSAAKSGQWAMLGMLVVIGAVAAVRKFVPWAPLKGKVGGWALNFVGAAAVALLASVQGGVAFKDAVLPALGLAFAAAGGYEALRDLIPWLVSLVSPKVGPA